MLKESEIIKQIYQQFLVVIASARAKGQGDRAQGTGPNARLQLPLGIVGIFVLLFKKTCYILLTMFNHFLINYLLTILLIICYVLYLICVLINVKPYP